MASIHLPSRTHAPFPPETTTTDNFFTKSPLLLFRLRLWRRRRRQSPPRVTKRTFRNRKGGGGGERERRKRSRKQPHSLVFPDGGQKQKKAKTRPRKRQASKRSSQILRLSFSQTTYFLFPLFHFLLVTQAEKHEGAKKRKKPVRFCFRLRVSPPQTKKIANNPPPPDVKSVVLTLMFVLLFPSLDPQWQQQRRNRWSVILLFLFRVFLPFSFLSSIIVNIPTRLPSHRTSKLQKKRNTFLLISYTILLCSFLFQRRSLSVARFGVTAPTASSSAASGGENKEEGEGEHRGTDTLTKPLLRPPTHQTSPSCAASRSPPPTPPCRPPPRRG